jgi:sulfane dehydrogenase subunit SoxC
LLETGPRGTIIPSQRPQGIFSPSKFLICTSHCVIGLPNDRRGGFMNSKQSSRRRFLKSSAVLAGIAAGGILPASAQHPDEHAIIPAGGVRPLGVGSPFEKSVRVGSATEGLTPHQDLHGIITPTELHFYVNHEYGYMPNMDPKDYRLLIHGMVDRPLIFNLEELKRLPSVSRIHFIECNGNSNPGRVLSGKTVQDGHGRTSCAEWTGVLLSLLLKEAGVHKDATWILAVAADTANHGASLPMAKAMDDIVIAYAMNGESLCLENGYPVRMVVPGWGGRIHVKWLSSVKAVDQPYMTTQDRASYMANGGAGEGAYMAFSEKGRMWQFEIYPKSIITYPSGGHQLHGPGFYEINGLAWSGGGVVRRVEVSTDAGRTWKDAQLQEPILSKAHTRFRFPWTWNGSEAVLQSRCTDEKGDVQPSVHEVSKNWDVDEGESCTSVLGADCMRVPRRANRAYIMSWRVAPDGSVHNAFELTPEAAKLG